MSTDVTKMPLFDRIFKPQEITLANGHKVLRPRSRLPLIAACVLIALYIAVQVTGFDLKIILARGSQLTKILSQIFHPDRNYFSKVVGPLLDTIRMSLIGTILGCLIGLPVAIASSSNINKNRPTLLFFRLILAIMRSVPTLIIASIDRKSVV